MADMDELVRQYCEGKSEEQVKVVEYFCKGEGCLSSNITDDEYSQMVATRRDLLNLKARALGKIGLDEKDISEISPAQFEGYVFGKAFAKKRADGAWVSSAYQVAWLFFSSTQVYVYRYTFNMDNDRTKEDTDEFFYKDVTSFSTSSETETAQGLDGEEFEIETSKFKIVVPGDKIFISMDGVPNAEAIIQGMKQKLREKKHQ